MRLFMRLFAFLIILLLLLGYMIKEHPETLGKIFELVGY